MKSGGPEPDFQQVRINFKQKNKILEIRKNKVEAWFSAADLTNQEETEEMVKEFISKSGVINGIITNAGGDIAGRGKNAEGGKAESNSFLKCTFSLPAT